MLHFYEIVAQFGYPGRDIYFLGRELQSLALPAASCGAGDGGVGRERFPASAGAATGGGGRSAGWGGRDGGHGARRTAGCAL